MPKNAKPTQADALAVIEGWKHASRRVRQARATPFPAQVNAEITAFADDTPAKFLKPLMTIWAGDNLFREARFSEAHDAYAKVDLDSKDAEIADQQQTAWQRMSLCQERAGDLDGAVETLRRFQENFPEHKLSTELDIAGMYEEHGRVDAALKTYQSIAKVRGKTTQVLNAKAIAERQLETLRLDLPLPSSPTEATRALANMLGLKDEKAVQSLASSQFLLGIMASHPFAAKRAPVLKQLLADLKASTVRVDPHRYHAKGDKLYLPTAGWKGTVFQGDVVFLLHRTRRGWEWRGVLSDGLADPSVITKLAEPIAGDSSTPKQLKAAPTLTIADLQLKSPWPRGRHFRAGGLWKFVAEQAAVVTVPWPFNMAVLADFASRPCGFGPSGYYYNQGPTHSSSVDRYSIDFTSYRRYLAYQEISTGTPVLSVAHGVVKQVREWVAGGSTSTDNHVYIDHYSDAELIGAIITALVSGTLPRSCYAARYLHLDGPNQIPVSVGMFVERGTALGTMDDTGNSSASHLHFSMHDNRSSSSGVRPTPMDGQTLTDADDGRSMYSTNDPLP